MKLLARIFRQKGGQVNSYTLYLWNNAGKGCPCILMSYITWPSLAYLIILFLLFANDSTHFLYWCCLWVQGSYSLLQLLYTCLVIKNETWWFAYAEWITRTQEICHMFWGKDLYHRYQSGICLMRGSIITILSRHEYTHAFMLVQMWV